MPPHLQLGGLLYLLSWWPLAYLNWRLRGQWSAFRVFLLWLLASNTVLIPLLWRSFLLYSLVSWPCRAVTVVAMFAVLGEELDAREMRVSNSIIGLFVAAPILLNDAGPSWRFACFVIALGCAAVVIFKKDKRIAVGLLIFALFPAISESPATLQAGQWLRLIPTLSAWLAYGVWMGEVGSSNIFTILLLVPEQRQGVKCVNR